MTALSETFLLWFRVAWEIWLEGYSLRHTSWSFSDTILCAYCKPIYIHHYLVCNYAWQQNSHSLWVCYTPNNGFTANSALFYNSKILHHDLWDAASIASTWLLQCCSTYSWWYKYMYANTKKYDTTSYIGIGQVQNGVLSIRYKRSSKITTAEWCKTHRQKPLALSYTCS